MATITGTDSADRLVGGWGDDLILGDSGNDTILGGSGNDRIYGGYGDDTIDGEEGADTLYGDDGNDILMGGAGADTLNGGEGADRLDGGDGDDLIIIEDDTSIDLYRGGAGADTFSLDLQWSFPPQSSLQYLDHIADFSAAEGDRISLGVTRGAIHTTYMFWNGAITTPGFNLSFGQSLPPGLGQGIWTWKSGDTTYLIIDAFGDRILDNRDIVLAFDGAPTLTAASFSEGTFVAVAGTAGPDNWTGSTGDDVYFGGAGDDKAQGLAGNDYLVGEAGSDTLDGGDGDDKLVGDQGSDTLYGGAGNDELHAGHWPGGGDDVNSVNLLYGGDGNDVLHAGEGKDTLDGGAGDDILLGLYGGAGDILRGGEGNDTLEANEGTLDGGAGDDRISIGFKNLITGGSGADRFERGMFLPWDKYGFSTITDFKASEGDRLDVGNLYFFERAVFRGALVNPDFSLTLGKTFSSNDYGDGFTQFWTWSSGGDTYLLIDTDRSTTLTANDYVLKFTGSVVLDASAFAYDYFTAGPVGGTDGADVFNGTSGADIFDGLAADDQIHGGDGDDTLSGSRGADQIWGDAGNDKLYGGEGDDVIYGGDGFDQIYDGRGKDTIYGGAGGDTIYLEDGAGEGGNLVYGGDGDDIVHGGTSQNDRIYGGNGNDVIYGSGEIHGDAGNDIIQSLNGASVIYGGDGDDFIAATYGAAVIYGGAGADQVFGGYGDDILHVDLADKAVGGVTGDDLFMISAAPAGEVVRLTAVEGGGDNNTFAPVMALGDSITLTLLGGEGVDTLDLSRAAGEVQVDLARTDGQLTGMGRLTLSSIEAVIGGDHGGAMFGSAWANSLTGGLGVDRISGREGDDVLTGGRGDDFLDGGVGQDQARYSGALSTYAIGVDATGWNVRDSRADGDGFDRLTGIEALAFKDKTIALGDAVLGLGVASVLRINAALGAGGDMVIELSKRVAAGTLSAAAAISEVVSAADATTSVASMSYQFFTGRTPSALGFDFLVSPTGPNSANLNSEAYAKFNTVNRYINFAMNLGRNGEAKDSFAAEYGSLTLFEATRKAYGVIFGSVPNDAKVTQLLEGRVAFLASFSGDPAEGIGTKAAMVGFLLAAAATENVGVFARSNDAWLTDLADGSAPYAVNLIDPANGYYKADFVYGG